jgi:hypothetical protein
MVKNGVPHRWAGTISLHETWKSVILCFGVVLPRTAFLNTKAYKRVAASHCYNFIKHTGSELCFGLSQAILISFESCFMYRDILYI